MRQAEGRSNAWCGEDLRGAHGRRQRAAARAAAVAPTQALLPPFLRFWLHELLDNL